MMHPTIKAYWEKFGTIREYDARSWEVSFNDSKIDIIIAYVENGIMQYYKDLITQDILYEKEMLSYIKLQAFI